MTRPRLSENRSTTPLVQEDEQVVASSFPVSENIHQVVIVLNKSRKFEYVDRITAVVDRNEIYHKESGEVSLEIFNQIQNEIKCLAELNEQVFGNIDFDNVDTLYYEDLDRRSLYFWHLKKRTFCSTWSDNFFEDYSIPQPSLARLLDQFNKVWNLLLPIPEYPLFLSDESRKDQTWTFPLKSNSPDQSR